MRIMQRLAADRHEIGAAFRKIQGARQGSRLSFLQRD